MKVLEINGETCKVRISPSFINNAACPQYLYLNYVKKISDKFVRVPAERGRIAHNAIEQLAKRCYEEKRPVSSITEVELSDALTSHMTPACLEETENILLWLRLWKERYVLPETLYGIEEKLAIDNEFEETGWESGAYRGILDLLEIDGDHAIVTDWKSQPHILGQGELDSHEQLSHYCWLLSKYYPYLKSFTARIWYLRYGFAAETTRTINQLEEYEKALMIKERSIMRIKNWDPIPGKHCGYCDFIHLCKLTTEEDPDLDNIITQAQAAKAASQVTVIEQRLKVLKAKLKDYVKGNDEVLIGDSWVYGFKDTPRTEWNAPAVVALLRESGLAEADVGKVMSLNGTKLKPFLKKLAKLDPGLEAQIRTFSTIKHGTRFGGYKRGDNDEEELDE